jgi:hypothetical protein
MATKESDTKKTATGKGSRHRSPAYPFVSLSEALEKAEAIFRQDKRAYASPEAILSHLGLSATGGKARRIVSAMRQYGLLDEDSGKYRISDAAFKIINLSESSEERRELIRQAAITPPIISRTVEIFGGELPSDATLKDHLITGEDFNPDSVTLFIRVLRETLDFAKIPSVGYNRLEQPEQMPMSQPHSTQPKLTSPPRSQFFGGGEASPPTGQLPFPLYLSKSQKATLYIPASLTRKEYDLLRKQIENSLDIIEATILADDEQPEPES